MSNPFSIYSGRYFVVLRKRCTFAGAFGSCLLDAINCVSVRRAKREAGENPAQSRCCISRKKMPLSMSLLTMMNVDEKTKGMR